MTLRSLFPPACVLALAAASPLRADLSSGSPHYNAGAPYGFIANAPETSGEIFYYNDFNIYDRQTGGSTRYIENGTAVIGNARGSFSAIKTGDSTTPTLNYHTTAGTTTPNLFDPSVTLNDDAGASLNSGGYVLGVGVKVPAGSADLESGGVRFSLSTIGYENIHLSFDFAISTASSSGNYLFRASNDGGVTWFFSENVNGLSPLTWYSDFTYDFSSDAGVANNASFVFEMLSVPDSDGIWRDSSGNAMTTPGKTNNNFSLDRITLSGDAIPIPEPAVCAAALGLAAGALAWRRRRRG